MVRSLVNSDLLVPRAIAFGTLAIGAAVAYASSPQISLFIATGALVVPWAVGIVELLGRPTAPPIVLGPEESPPPAVLIVAAYLPNEAEVILPSVRALLNDIDYPGPWRILVAYNTDKALHVERELAELASSSDQLSIMEVAGSITKAENLNAALATTTEGIVGILDANARPSRCALRRAARWIESGWDFVQGANLISPHATPMERAVGAEFAAKYLATYAGRFARAGVVYFSGSNGYWSGNIVRSLRFDDSAYVEDIDCAVRALLVGRRMGFDPDIRCWESAPASWRGLWRQRLRWAYGWAQLTGRYALPLSRARPLSALQRAFWVHATAWRRAVVPAAAVVIATTATNELVHRRPGIPVVVVISALVVAWLAGLTQGITTARRRGVPHALARPAWYAAIYVGAELARLYASIIVLVRRPPWTPTPRPNNFRR